MDKKALYNLSYGVFMLATRSGNVVNGCITNTCIQVANNPVRIAISVLDVYKRQGYPNIDKHCNQIRNIFPVFFSHDVFKEVQSFSYCGFQ